MKRVSLAAAAALLAFPASAQMVQPLPSVATLAPSDLLASHLRTLSRSPRDLNALLGAGQAALEVGDPNAALGFFGRAQTVDPRNGRAKAGLASALVQLERPDEALQLFGEAQALGISETTFLRDRGLAYDLRGDSRRAQKDYAAALKATPADAELVRRYGLSLGISGDRAEALTMLDPLLHRQDPGAWRARAFILAMTGDVAGGKAVARQVMPAGLAATMAPFLARLANLNPAERAHAVNFGTMPADGQALASVRLGDPYRGPDTAPPPATVAVDRGLIPAGPPLGPKPAAELKPVAPAKPPATVIAARETPSPLPTTTVAPAPAAISAPVPAPPRVQGPPVSDAATPAFETVPVVPVLPPVASDSALTPTPTPAPAPTSAAPAPVKVATAPPEPAPAPVPVSPGLGSVVATLEREGESEALKLPTIAEMRAQQRLSARKAKEAADAAAAKVAAEKAAKEAKEEKARRDAELAKARANPARLWVQVATGSNAAGFSRTWSKIRDANPALQRYQGYVFGGSRIVAGPVKSAADAKSVVAALAKGGLRAMTYSSEAGEEAVKIAAK